MTEHAFLPVVKVHWYGEGIYEIHLDREGIEFTPGDCFALYAGNHSPHRLAYDE